MVPQDGCPKTASEVSEKIKSPAPAQQQKEKPLSLRSDATASSQQNRHTASFIHCDGKQEPQPRNLSCRISTCLEELVTRHAYVYKRGHHIQRQRIL
jgi:hypothetical protein